MVAFGEATLLRSGCGRLSVGKDFLPHSGQESSKGTAPICEDGIEVPRRTTETFPRVIGRDDSGAQPDLEVGYMAGFMMAPSGTTPSLAL